MLTDMYTMHAARLLLAASVAVGTTFANTLPRPPRGKDTDFLRSPRYVVYMDQWHTAVWPNETVTAGITHVITAFANSSLFITDPGEVYTPFMDLADIRGLFDDDIQLCMGIGGWGDTAGFGLAAKNLTMMRRFARNVADTLDRLDYDCVDIDWEYPGGNGADYKQIPNNEKTSEVEAFPRLLREIKAAIGPDRGLSIAVPGLMQDMIAMHTIQQMSKIKRVVDFVNVMAYDLANRRSQATRHHTSVAGAERVIDTYLRMGLPAHKIVLGFALYAKWLTTGPNTTKSSYPSNGSFKLPPKYANTTQAHSQSLLSSNSCPLPIDCPLARLEDSNGADTKLSGVLTFEESNLSPPPANMSVSPSAACGFAAGFRCGDGNCCSEYGFCGETPEHCGLGCQKGYGQCAEGVVDIAESFAKARELGETDAWAGGHWWFDDEAKLFWSWETPELIDAKIWNLVQGRGLGGVMAWSLGEDSYDWSHVLALQRGVEMLRSNRERVLQGDLGIKPYNLSPG